MFAALQPLASDLLRWYDRQRRIMPWRALAGQRPNPYHVWLSEIMLQQTTVAAVGPYFQKFIKRWPTLHDLAAAELDQIMQMWAGLGYYRRARMLHRCARILRDDYGGIFPETEKELLKLPGFGLYTAAAVAAIAFDRPANVVDGNVERVMARIFAIQQPLPQAKATLREAAAGLMPQKRCGDYAQALMDLGATICAPRAPKCDPCPWQRNCQAYALGIQATLPRRVEKKAKPVRRAVAFVLQDKQGRIFLRQRPAQGLLGGMMEVPSSPWLPQSMPGLAAVLDYAPIKAKWIARPGAVKHVFTHFTLQITVAVAQTSRQLSGVWSAQPDLKHQALPGVMNKIIMHALTPHTDR